LTKSYLKIAVIEEKSGLTVTALVI